MDQSAFGKLFKTYVPHILEKIFFSLDYESFKVCHEVCEAWNGLLSNELMKEKAKKILMENGDKLRHATEEGNADEVRGFLSAGMVDVDVNELDNYHFPILHSAVMNGLDMVVNQLLNAGADISKADPKGNTLLHYAARKKQTGMAELLLDGGANLNKANEFGSTPLHMAAGCGHKNVVKLLIERGAQVDKVERSDVTPLHRAVYLNRREMVQILLDVGADPTKSDDMGHTPEFHARRLGRLKIVKMLTEAKCQEASERMIKNYSPYVYVSIPKEINLCHNILHLTVYHEFSEGNDLGHPLMLSIFRMD